MVRVGHCLCSTYIYCSVYKVTYFSRHICWVPSNSHAIYILILKVQLYIKLLNMLKVFLLDRFNHQCFQECSCCMMVNEATAN